jgi:hypothetical protein
MVDLLQPNSSGSLDTLYGKIYFTSDTSQPTGSGIFDPFLTIQKQGIEQGYNSSSASAPFDVKRIPQYNHEFTLAEMKANASVTMGNATYYRFLIDVNEPNSTDKSRISLDSLQLYTSATAGQTTTNVASLGVKRFDIDIDTTNTLVDNWVAYDDLNHGSGQADIAVLVPASAFAGVADSQYVYMYQKWGEHVAADDLPVGSQGGFEETRLGGVANVVKPVPEPSIGIPLAGMLMMVAGCHRRPRRITISR